MFPVPGAASQIAPRRAGFCVPGAQTSGHVWSLCCDVWAGEGCTTDGVRSAGAGAGGQPAERGERTTSATGDAWAERGYAVQSNAGRIARSGVGAADTTDTHMAGLER